MSAQIIDGKAISEQLKAQVKEEAARLSAQGIQPGLAVVIVGENPASQVYVRNKAKTCEQLGMYSEVHRLPESTTEEELLALIGQLNSNERIHGILVQQPLPSHFDQNKIDDAILPEKDVDAFHPVNVGNLTSGHEGFLPCTPAGVMELLKRTGVELAGKHAVVVGRSNIVGKPMAMLLLREHATVTVCHSRSANMADITRQADILVAAVGKPGLIRKEHVKPGAIVIDVGINRLDTGKLAGDVAFEEVAEVAGAITPVPGGVGPMTIAMLMYNTLESAERAAKRQQVK
ncbi:bifunctional methylenetetrahydrofolate dehydrogenase/methenyltetrahydrofolate cyclohydrolase FolD [Paenibacillus turpanensis]|uniref:bifunctional methylenetetrahydrofolate dehydrogenase/methenyltetrahydrofolate cyclohydrolase FolD n=1 Tax=Paenibacillus turpanensis TaxID=2689078 RepID=UPI00140A0571|nr:bifunctional methylenetetrahydrofolate dehydrogenase/methenyltetrahydrofolate cyclohydrolase FolD [Paenibacillus turpanensis]